MLPRRPRPGDGEEQLLKDWQQWKQEQAKQDGKEEPQGPADGAGAGEEPLAGAKHVLLDRVQEQQKVKDLKFPSLDRGCFSSSRTRAQLPPALPLGLLSGRAVVSESTAPPQGQGEPRKKKKSLFAQHVQARAVPDSASASEGDSQPGWGTKSLILQGSGLQNPEKDLLEIHQSNVSLLESASAQQRIEMRNQVLATVSQETIQFLKRKKVSGQVSLPKPPVAAASLPEPPVEKPTRLPDPSSESSKREWMNPSSRASPKTDDSTSALLFSARFDLEGLLLPFDADVPVTSALHHHAEEPDRAGYTLEELLILFRSTNTSQKILATNVLAKLVLHSKEGIYDHVLDGSLLERLCDTDLVLLLRSLIDDKIEAVREAAFFCMRQLIDNQFDELALEQNLFSLHGHRQPSLPSGTWKDQGTQFLQQDLGMINDAKLAQVDVILALLRTNLIERISYLFQSLQPSSSATKNMLSILCRFARHSDYASNQIIVVRSLWKPLASFISAAAATSRPVIATMTLKLIRIISAWKVMNATELVTKMNLVDLMPPLLAAEGFNSKVSIQAFSLWDTLLRQNLLTHLYGSLSAPLYRPLLKLRECLSDSATFTEEEELVILWKHASAILKTLSVIRQLHAKDSQSVMQDADTIVRDCAIILIKRFKNWYKPDEAALCSAGVKLLALLLYHLSIEEHPETSKLVESTLLPFLNSADCSPMTSSCLEHSGLLSKLSEGRERDPSSLPSLGAVTFGGQLIPGLGAAAPYDLLEAILKVARTANQLQGVFESLFTKTDFAEYVQQLSVVQNSSKISSNWFVSSEHRFLCSLIESAPHELSYWRMSAKLLPQVSSGAGPKVCQDMFRLCLDLASKMFNMEDHLPDIRRAYLAFIPPLASNLTCPDSGEAFVPIDWIYLPLVKWTQAEASSAQVAPEESINTLTVSLFWIHLILEHNATTLVASETSLHMSRLLTLFQDGTYFLEEPIQTKLKNVLRILYRPQNERPDCSLPTPGIDSFRNFYQAIVDHYQAASYGNLLFGLFVLLPSLQNESLATILWLEHPVALRTMRLRFEDLPEDIAAAELVYSDCSVDLFRCFARAIISKTVQKETHPVLFKMAEMNLKEISTSVKHPKLKKELNDLSERLNACGCAI